MSGEFEGHWKFVRAWLGERLSSGHGGWLVAGWEACGAKRRTEKPVVG